MTLALSSDLSLSSLLGASAKEPLVFKTREKMTLHQLIVYNIEQGGDGLVFHVDCYNGLPSEDNKPFVTNAKLQVVDIARYDHFDFTTKHCPQQSTFFLYGDRSSAFLAHIPNKSLDFLQVRISLYNRPFAVRGHMTTSTSNLLAMTK